MPLTTLPMEASGPLWGRWIHTLLRPLRERRSFWLEVFRGEGWGTPLRFAYLTLLPTLPLVGLAMHLGLSHLRAVMGPYSSLSLATSLQVVPGTLLGFLFRPLVAALVSAALMHALLWVVEPEARGQFRVTLRVVTYATAWLIPFFALLTALVLYIQLNPLAARQASQGFPMSAYPSALGLGVALGALILEGMGVLFTAWGLRVAHQSRFWKTLPAALLGALGGAIFLANAGGAAGRAAVTLILKPHRAEDGMAYRSLPGAQHPRSRGIRLS